MLKIRVMNISKKELGKTLKKFKGTAWDQSPLFKKLYEEEYGQFGGEPYGCLVGDYYFDHSPPDVELLGEMAQDRGRRARAVHRRAPRRRVMQMDRWQELANPRDLTKIFQTPEYAAWRSLRESRGLALHRPGHAALPRAPAVRRQDRSGRGVRLRGRHRRRRHAASTPGPTPPTRWRSNINRVVQAVRLVLADPRRRVAAARSRACRRTPSRPTTAAST